MIKWEKQTDGDDTFFIRKYRKHWWQSWKTTMDGEKTARYDCISGIMYQRVKENYYKEHIFIPKEKKISL